MPRTISAPYEVDIYSVHLLPDVIYGASVLGFETGLTSGLNLTLPDPFIIVVDIATETPIAVQDASKEGSVEALITFTVPREDDYYIGVTDLTGGTGDYGYAVVGSQGTPLTSTLFSEVVIDPVTTAIVDHLSGDNFIA